MGDVLERIHQAVSVVVRGVDAPLVAGMGVLGELDAVRDQIKPAAREEGSSSTEIERLRMCRVHATQIFKLINLIPLQAKSGGGRFCYCKF